MKKIFLLLISILAFGTSNAQFNIYDFKNYKFEDETDYKAAEPMVAEVAILLLSIPIDKEETAREDAIDFLYNWMVGTPDYVFGTGRMRIILGEDFQLIGLSFAAQVKYALENSESVKDNPEAQRAIWSTIADYIGKRSNHVDLSPKLKELVSANKSGKLDEFIKKHE